MHVRSAQSNAHAGIARINLSHLIRLLERDPAHDEDDELVRSTAALLADHVGVRGVLELPVLHEGLQRVGQQRLVLGVHILDAVKVHKRLLELLNDVAAASEQACMVLISKERLKVKSSRSDSPEARWFSPA